MVESQEGYTVSIKIYNSIEVVIIDEIDHPKVWDDLWYLHRKKHTNYARSRHRYMHTVLTGFDNTDHKDRDGLNNTRENMRESTRSQNAINYIQTQGPNGSGYRGVSWAKTGWQARVQTPKKRQEYLGIFKSAEDAARAYDAKAREYHGEFAVLNFPNEE